MWGCVAPVRERPLHIGEGLVAQGFEADLVAVEGNPLEDITSVRKVAFVMKGGKVVKH